MTSLQLAYLDHVSAAQLYHSPAVMYNRGLNAGLDQQIIAKPFLFIHCCQRHSALLTPELAKWKGACHASGAA